MTDNKRYQRVTPVWWAASTTKTTMTTAVTITFQRVLNAEDGEARIIVNGKDTGAIVSKGWSRLGGSGWSVGSGPEIMVPTRSEAARDWVRQNFTPDSEA